MYTNAKQRIKASAKKAVKFMRENKTMMAQLAVMGYIALTNDTTFAQDNSGGTFSVVTTPLKTFSDTITGPVATAIGTAGAALLGLSVSMNFENQIAKRGVQGVGGIALGTAAGGVVAKLGGGLLF